MSKMLDVNGLREAKTICTPTILPNGWTVYMQNGHIHREDGPAIISENHQEYYQNSRLHNENGPARLFIKSPIGDDRHAEWWSDGKLQATALLDHVTFHKHWNKK